MANETVPAAPPVHTGGSFAPPLSDAKIAEYRAVITARPASPERDACASLLKCCVEWWNLPEPVGTKIWDHPSGKGQIVAMQDDHQKHLYDHIPWKHELDAMAALFEGIPNETEKSFRDMAFHLLWHVIELNLDREPLTKDKL